jgi:tape measure domain-containing protein
VASQTSEWTLKIGQAGASRAASQVGKLTRSLREATVAYEGLTRAATAFGGVGGGGGVGGPLRGGASKSARPARPPRAPGAPRRTAAGQGVAPTVAGAPVTVLQRPVAAAFRPARSGAIAQRPVAAAMRPGRSSPKTLVQRPVAAAFKRPPAPRPGGGAGGGGGGAGAAGGSVSGASAMLGSIGGQAALLGGTAGAVVAAATQAKDLAVSAGTMAVKGGAWVVKTAEARNNMFTAFEVMQKSEAKAAELMGGIEKFARDTPFTTDQVGDVMKQLVGAGYDAKEAFDIFKRVGDTSAFANFSDDALKGVTRAITQIKSKGKLSAEELNQIFEAAPGAVSRETLVDMLAKNTGRSVTKIKDELENGKITSAEGIKAILDTIDSTISGGVAGGLMAKLGSSITGRLSSLADLPSMLVGMTRDLPGLKLMGDALGNLLAGFDEAAGPLKAQVQGAINDIFGALFGGLGGSGGKDTFKNIFLGIAEGIAWVRETARTLKPYVLEAYTIFQAFWGGFKEAFVAVAPVFVAIWEGIKKAFGGENKSMLETVTWLARKFGVALGWVAVIVGTIVSAIIAFGQLTIGIITAVAGAFAWMTTFVAGLLGGTLLDVLGTLPARALQVGIDFVAGLANGILSSLGLVSGAAGKAAEAAVSGTTTPLEIHSPSRVAERLGGHFAGGFAGGIEGSLGGVSAAAGSMADAATGGASVGLLGGPGGGGGAGAGGGGPVVNIYVDATGLGDREAGEAVGEKLGGVVAAELRRYFEEAAGAMGATGFAGA